MLCDSTYITSLKIQKCRTGEQISDFKGLKREGSGREVGVAIKRPPPGIPVDIEMFCILTVSLSTC